MEWLLFTKSIVSLKHLPSVISFTWSVATVNQINCIMYNAYTILPYTYGVATLYHNDFIIDELTFLAYTKGVVTLHQINLIIYDLSSCLI